MTTPRNDDAADEEIARRAAHVLAAATPAPDRSLGDRAMFARIWEHSRTRRRSFAALRQRPLAALVVTASVGAALAGPLVYVWTRDEGPSPRQLGTRERAGAQGGQRGEAARAVAPLRRRQSLVPRGAGTSAAGLHEAVAAAPLGHPPLGPDEVSHWIEPWRALVRTRPARVLRDAAGITVAPTNDDATRLPPLLARAGFARVAFAIPWSAIGYDNPDALDAEHRTRKRAWLQSLRDNRLRPLIKVFGDRSYPAPRKGVTINLLAKAPLGARQIRVDAASAALLVPGRSGLDTPGIAADVLFTAILPDGTALLSRPLEIELPAGHWPASLLRYAPFEPPRLANGEVNPVFEDTMDGWLRYLGAVCREASDVLGPEGFDLEIWNDGSAFLDLPHHYGPLPPGRALFDRSEIPRVVAERTAAWLANAGASLRNVRLVDSYSSSGSFASVPAAGAHAQGGHVIARSGRFPALAEGAAARSVTATGAPNGGRAGDGAWREAFTPRYDVAFPEIPLSGLPSRDRLFPSLEAHARTPALMPSVFVTAFNLNPEGAAQKLGVSLDEPARWRFKTKSVLRALSAFVGAGTDAIYFYTARDRHVGLVAASDPSGGGPVLAALGRFSGAFAGPDTLRRPRALRVQARAGGEESFELEGGPTAETPAITHRSAAAFFPFQVDDDTFVVSAYVMTRSLARTYGSAGSERQDLPALPFSVAIRGVKGGTAQVTAVDPLTGETVPVAITARTSDEIVVDVGLTDAPRLLRVTDRSASASP